MLSSERELEAREDTLVSHSPGEESKEDDGAYQVTLSPADDPVNMSLARKWLIVLIISSASLCVTCASSIVRLFVPEYIYDVLIKL